ncbi:MAG TPA: amidohydrolase family protein [Syntrophorhabdaceae bacterium]|nr:amidohydrolase family protein [Syntrophorhabdaceae bacterium]
MGGMLIKNIGMVFTGDISNPLIEGPISILIEDGKIRSISKEDLPDTEKMIDANGMTICPGFIDSHTHPVFGDFTPRQNQIGFIDSSLHGGVTAMISAGEVHLPGRPTDPKGTKALAVLAHKSFAKMRPAGVKVYGGALILEKGLVEEDFKELAEDGVWLVGEIGLGSIKTASEAKIMVEWSKKYGMKVLMHVGGTSIPGSSTVTCEDVLTARPTVACHLNGGPTSVPVDEARRIINETDCAIEIVHCGNPLSAFEIARYLKNKEMLNRLIIGNDAPSGTGVIPLGIWRMVNFISSLCGISAELAVCCATGNTMNVFGLKHGTIKEGYEADLQIIDAPMGSDGKDAKAAIEIGDIPGIAMVIIDGVIKTQVSRNTPPPVRKTVVKQ